MELRNGRWLKKLAELPESGMGYQIVDITLKNGRIIERATVFNCERVYFPGGENICEEDIAEIQMSN